MKRLTLALGLLTLAAVLAACSGASAAPTTGTPAPAGSPAPAGGTVSVVAKDIKFVTPSIAVTAGAGFTIAFDNQDGAPHNVAISDASGAMVFKGESCQPPIGLAKRQFSMACSAPPECALKERFR